MVWIPAELKLVKHLNANLRPLERDLILSAIHFLTILKRKLIFIKSCKFADAVVKQGNITTNEGHSQASGQCSTSTPYSVCTQIRPITRVKPESSKKSTRRENREHKPTLAHYIHCIITASFPIEPSPEDCLISIRSQPTRTSPLQMHQGPRRPEDLDLCAARRLLTRPVSLLLCICLYLRFGATTNARKLASREKQEKKKKEMS